MNEWAGCVRMLFLISLRSIIRGPSVGLFKVTNFADRTSGVPNAPKVIESLLLEGFTFCQTLLATRRSFCVPERDFSFDDAACCDDKFESDIVFVILIEVFCKPLEIKVVVGKRDERIPKKESSTSAETIKTHHSAMPFEQREMYLDKVIVLLGYSNCLETEYSACSTLSLCTVSSLEYQSKIDKGGGDNEAAPTLLSRESGK